MTDYPDFCPNGFLITKELGRNSIGGRVTYLARETNTQQQVVIKQFQFAKMGATWAEYDAYSQEIAMLQHLDRPGIPRYLDSFQTETGFCMVQEYINAESLAVSRSWTPQEIKQVAIATLEILVYLQSQGPPVIHRDIKPENILADENLNIYLVDFGFARLGGGEIAASSVVKGTMGFMPPEQLFNRQLTEASDLYGLGATLICLLTGIKSGDIGNLIDENYQIQFQHLVPPLKRGLISWLEKISQPNQKDRYGSAREALAALHSIDVDRLPKVRIDRNSLEFVTSEFGQKATQTITISNPIPETILAGRLEVAPHPKDPPHTPYDHSWVEFDSYKFEGNKVKSKITVDTSKLLAGKTYHRELLLHSNSDGEPLKIPITAKTAPLPKARWTYLYWIIGAVASPVLILFLPSILIGLIVSKRAIAGRITTKNADIMVVSNLASLALLLWVASGLLASIGNFYSGPLVKVSLIQLLYSVVHSLLFAEIVTWMLAKLNPNQRKRCYFYLIVLFGILLVCSNPGMWMEPIIATIVATAIWGLLSLPASIVAENIRSLSVNPGEKFGLKNQDSFKSMLLSVGLATSGVLAYFLLPKVFDPVYALSLTIAEKILVAIVAIAPPIYCGFRLTKIIIKRWRAIARYRREKPNLIQP
ncbi:MAG: serine/threonine-protein kinase [Cyanobacteriota bacterium]|nr:serine/threonine-protein kinase [Cyanobacteriota bacterium]